MKKILFMLAVTTMLVSPTGCGACRNRWKAKHQPAAVAVPMCAPVACPPVACSPAPMCAPACGSCGPAGPVTYGYDSGPMMMGTTPMMVPTPMGSGSR